MKQHSDNKTILVAGGAGYIGSHAVLDLVARGYAPIVYDNFVTSNREISKKLNVTVAEGALEDKKTLKETFLKYQPKAVMHFAAHAYVGESVTNPLKYYRNNVAATISLLEVMEECKVKQIIFSSTCATYGTPEKLPITEETPQNPINPYGMTKFAVEKMLYDCERAWGLRSVIFRYFNAAGASKSGLIGEDHDPETHLVPLVIQSALLGAELKVFGDDYPTKDGTCIRDYIHVEDISDAHVKGFEYLEKGGKTDAFNIGTENGTSVKEVIDCVEKQSKKKVNYKIVERREGDPAVLIASSNKLMKTLGWTPKYKRIDEIVETALRWHSR